MVICALMLVPGNATAAFASIPGIFDATAWAQDETTRANDVKSAASGASDGSADEDVSLTSEDDRHGTDDGHDGVLGDDLGILDHPFDGINDGNGTASGAGQNAGADDVSSAGTTADANGADNATNADEAEDADGEADEADDGEADDAEESDESDEAEEEEEAGEQEPAQTQEPDEAGVVRPIRTEEEFNLAEPNPLNPAEDFNLSGDLIINGTTPVDSVFVEEGDPFSYTFTFNLADGSQYLPEDTFYVELPSALHVENDAIGKTIYLPGSTYQVAGTLKVKNNKLMLQLTPTYLTLGRKSLTITVNGTIQPPAGMVGKDQQITVPGIADAITLQYYSGNGLNVEHTYEVIPNNENVTLQVRYTITLTAQLDQTGIVVSDAINAAFDYVADSEEFDVDGPADTPMLATQAARAVTFTIDSMSRGSQVVISYLVDYTEIHTTSTTQASKAIEMTTTPTTRTFSATFAWYTDQISNTTQTCVTELHPVCFRQESDGTYDKATGTVSWRCVVVMGDFTEVTPFTNLNYRINQNNTALQEPVPADVMVAEYLNGTKIGEVPYSELFNNTLQLPRVHGVTDTYTFIITLPLKTDITSYPARATNRWGIVRNGVQEYYGSVEVMIQAPDVTHDSVIDITDRGFQKPIVTGTDYAHNTVSWKATLNVSYYSSIPYDVGVRINNVSNVINNTALNVRFDPDSIKIYRDGVELTDADLAALGCTYTFGQKRFVYHFDSIPPGNISFTFDTVYNRLAMASSNITSKETRIATAVYYNDTAALNASADKFFSTDVPIPCGFYTYTANAAETSGNILAYGLTFINDVYDDDFTIHDTLPAGTVVDHVTLDGTNLSDDRITDNGGTALFRVGQVADGTKMIIYLRITNADALQTAATYSNVVKFISQGVTSNTLTSTTRSVPVSLIKKTALYDGDTAPFVRYTATLNPYGLNLGSFLDASANTDSITLEDAVGSDVRFSPGSLLVNGVNWANYTLDDQNLTIDGLANNTSYTVTYSGIVMKNEGEELTDASNTIGISDALPNYDTMAKSTATLTGKALASNLIAEANIYSVNVLKQEYSPSDATVLNPLDAVDFTVYAYDAVKDAGGTWSVDASTETNVGTLTSAADGYTPFVSCEFNKVYRLVEESQPLGYVKPFDSGYFVRSKDAKALYAPDITVLQDYDYYTFNAYNEREQVAVNVAMNWDDANNQDGLRQPVVVRLVKKATDPALNNGAGGMVDVPVASAVLDETNNWSYSFAADKYDNGTVLRYEVAYDDVLDGYQFDLTESSLNDWTLTASHTPAKTQVSGTKTFANDNNDANGMRPAEITVKLLRDNQDFEQVTASAATNWQYSFANLDVYHDGGIAYAYTVAEVPLNDYLGTVTPNADCSVQDITNRYAPAETQVSARVTWEDAGNQDGIRPSALTYDVLCNGTATGEELVLDESNQWSATLSGLVKNINGSPAVYTLELAAAPAGYTQTGFGGDQASGYAFTYGHTPETTTLTATVTWDGDDANLADRPDSVSVALYDGTGWSKTFEVRPADKNANPWTLQLTDDQGLSDFPVFRPGAQGDRLDYTMTVGSVNNYAVAITGTDVTMTYSPNKTSVNYVVAWNDKNDNDGVRPDAATVTLYRQAKGSSTPPVACASHTIATTETLYLGTFDNLNSVEDDGTGNLVEQEYTVGITFANQGTPGGYTTTPSTGSGGEFVFVNYRPIDTSAEVTGAITWDDNANAMAMRPANLVVELLRDGAVVDTQTVTGNATTNANWDYAFTGLQRFHDGGIAYDYVVRAVNVRDYTSAVSAGNAQITMTYAPNLRTVNVSVVWNDDSNRDGVRPTLMATLVANGIAQSRQLVFSGTNDVQAFYDLNEYYNHNLVDYTIDLAVAPADSGYACAVTGDMERGFTITADYTPQRVDVPVTVVWDDHHNADGKRPSQLTLTLTNSVDGTTVSQTIPVEPTADSQACAFAGLYAYAQQQPVTWTLSQAQPTAYTTTYDQATHTVTNAYTPGKTAVTLTNITWLDDNNRDALRPNQVTIELYADGVSTGKSVEVTPDAFGVWTCTFDDLNANIYDNGASRPIRYSLVQHGVDLGDYPTQIVGSVSGGSVAITNVHVPETIEVSGSKTWKDADDSGLENANGMRPDAVTLHLFANGVDTNQPVVVTAANGWNYSFGQQPKNDAGIPITYTVIEEPVTDYTSVSLDPSLVTNTYTPGEYTVDVWVDWYDEDNQDGVRPSDVTVTIEGYNANDLLLYEKPLTIDESASLGSSHGIEMWHTIVTVPQRAQLQEIAYFSIHVEDLADANGEVVYEGYGYPDPYYHGLVAAYYHEPEQTTLDLAVTWDDAANQDGLRPDVLPVWLQRKDANGAWTNVSNRPLELSGSGDTWTLSVEADKYENVGGTVKEVEYRFAGASVTGYNPDPVSTETTSPYILTYTHTPMTTTVSGTKTWDDNDNKNGMRPGSIEVELMATVDVNGTQTTWNTGKMTTVTPDANGDWAYTFDNVQQRYNGKDIVYSVIEVSSTPDYTLQSVVGMNLVNEYTPDMKTVTVQVQWEDAGNQDGLRPDEVEIELQNDGATYSPYTVDNLGSWHLAVDVPRKLNGQDADYQIPELAITGYTCSVQKTGDAFIVLMSHDPATTTISGVKTWADANNQDGKRPSELTVRLMADTGNGPAEAAVATVQDNGTDAWAYEFADVPVYEPGEQGVRRAYTVQEDVPTGYTETHATTATGVDITNSYTPELVSVTANIHFEDNYDQDGKRPSAVEVTLYKGGANGIPVDSQTLSDGTGWTYTWSNLPRYSNGAEIIYAVVQTPLDPTLNYTTTTRQNGLTFDITNAHTPETFTISGTKTWDDADNQDGVRPSEMVLTLWGNGGFVKRALVSAANNAGANANEWVYEFADLPVYHNGHPIDYAVSEDYGVLGNLGYTLSSYGLQALTNERAPEKTQVEALIQWEDEENNDRVRPAAVMLQLMDGSGNAVGSPVSVDEGASWTQVWTNLAKYQSGTEIAYNVAITPASMTELTDAGYKIHMDKAATGVVRFELSRPIDTIAVNAAVNWDDDNNRDGIRYPAALELSLVYGDPAIGAPVDAGFSATVDEATHWAVTFTDVPKYKDGQSLTYSVNETVIENCFVDPVLSDSGYDLTIGATTTDATGAQAVTATLKHEPEMITVAGTVQWEDDDNVDSTRPADVTVSLVANGDFANPVATATPSATTQINGADAAWRYEFPVYKYEAEGVEIPYTISQNAVTGYQTAIDDQGLSGDVRTINAVNTRAADTQVYTVGISWQDNNDQDGFRPANVTATLVQTAADGTATPLQTVTLNEANPTLPFNPVRVNESQGVAYRYSVEYASVDPNFVQYYSRVDNYDAASKTFWLEATHVPETVAVTVTKVWDDANNQDGKRQDVTLELVGSNGTVYSHTLTGKVDESYTFADLPKRDQGAEITYNVLEASIPEYQSAVTGSAATGFTVTNSYTPQKTQVSVYTTWDDDNDADGKRPSQIEVALLQNGTATTKTLTLDAANNWEGTFVDLDVLGNQGTLAHAYTVQVTTTIDNNVYTQQAVVEVQNGVFQLLFVHVPDTQTLTGKKVWKDDGNRDKTRPNELEVQLFDGQTMVKSFTLNDANNWTWEFTDIQANRNDGTGSAPIDYTVVETPVANWPYATSGYDSATQTITNTYTPKKTSVPWMIVWDDDNNRDNVRPSDVTLTVTRFDTATNAYKPTSTTEKVATPTVSGSIANLPLNDQGVAIQYGIDASDVSGYTKHVVFDDDQKTWIITYTHTPDTVTVSAASTFNDDGNRDGLRPATVTYALYQVIDGKNHFVAKQVVPVASNETTSEGEANASFTAYKNYDIGTKADYVIEQSFDGSDVYQVKAEGDMANGFTFTNTYIPARRTITVKKVWDDADNNDGMRPATVTVRLLADDADTGKKLELTEANKWTAAFDGLYAYSDGKEVSYSVAEDAIEGYAATQATSDESGAAGSESATTTITNTHKPLLTSVYGDVTWDGDHNKPVFATVRLFANGAFAGLQVVDDANDWAYRFDRLPVYANGRKIVYTVTIDKMAGWLATVNRGETTISGATPNAASGVTAPATTSPEPVVSEVTVPEDENALAVNFTMTEEELMPAPAVVTSSHAEVIAHATAFNWFWFALFFSIYPITFVITLVLTLRKREKEDEDGSDGDERRGDTQAENAA